MKLWSHVLVIVAAAIAVALSAGCNDSSRIKADTELGLSPEQAAGRRVFEVHCQECHSAYTSSGKNGPSLEGVYKREFLPSGIPVNDDRIGEIVMRGKSKMPGFAGTISQTELQTLLSYLKTL